MEKLLRKLARSPYWQHSYSQTKSIGSLSLFENKIRLSKIQIIFLSWLNTYENLYKDLVNEEDYISQEVIDNDIRTDAYLFWRNTVKYKKQNKKQNQETDNPLGIPKVVFKSKRK